MKQTFGTNLEYLGKLCELIAEKYNQEYVWGETADESYLEVIRDYLKSKGLGYNTSLTPYESDKVVSC